ncbi:hypothetical protein R1flu_024167 [Riccia fluitans]|uniref:Uncharacterized protein n=1 Tax=Riccia fluitans TaxID=41844 RepID=A0ABD1XUK5_9MARC
MNDWGFSVDHGYAAAGSSKRICSFLLPSTEDCVFKRRENTTIVYVLLGKYETDSDLRHQINQSLSCPPRMALQYFRELDDAHQKQMAAPIVLLLTPKCQRRKLASPAYQCPRLQVRLTASFTRSYNCQRSASYFHTIPTGQTRTQLESRRLGNGRRE